MLPQFKLPARMLCILPWMRLITAAVLIGALGLTLLPSLFHTEAAVQIRTLRPGNNLPDGFYVYQALLSQGIHIKSITPDRDSLIIKFESQEQSIAAEKVLRQLLPVGFDIARQDKQSAENRINRTNLRT